MIFLFVVVDFPLFGAKGLNQRFTEATLKKCS